MSFMKMACLLEIYVDKTPPGACPRGALLKVSLALALAEDLVDDSVLLAFFR